MAGLTNNGPASDETLAIMAVLGVLGGLVGGFMGFVQRPANPFMGQLDFMTVLSRGDNLKGLDRLLVPLAQQSFTLMTVWGVIGVVAGLAVASFISKKRTPREDSR